MINPSQELFGRFPLLLSQEVLPALEKIDLRLALPCNVEHVDFIVAHERLQLFMNIKATIKEILEQTISQLFHPGIFVRRTVHWAACL